MYLFTGLSIAMTHVFDSDCKVKHFILKKPHAKPSKHKLKTDAFCPLLPNVPFRAPKRAVLACNMCRFAGRNVPFRNLTDYQPLERPARLDFPSLRLAALPSANGQCHQPLTNGPKAWARLPMEYSAP